MKIERIKKNHKKQILIGGLIAICLISAITITTSKAKYKLTDDIELAKGTINYKPYDFKVMAIYQSDDKTNYTEINEMPGKNYKINEEKSYCTINNVDKDDKANIYTNKYGEHIIERLSKTEKCYIYFDKNTEIVSTILGNIEVNNYTPDFSKIATSDEGIFKAYDNDGTSYYWRGSATTNYLKFANYCWRIIRINGDGTLRLIYDGTTCHNNGEETTDSIAVSNVAYNTLSNRSEYVGWTYVEGKQRPEEGDTEIDSNAKTKTEEWYNTNLTSYSDKIAEGKFCNDRNIDVAPSEWWNGYTTIWSSSGVAFTYSSSKRIWENGLPTLYCLNDTQILKVSLINIDEIMLAGGNKNNNLSYYLYNGQSYWTMTAEEWNGSAYLNVMNSNGNGTILKVNYGSNIRPVINLKSDIIISGGNGTLTSPYIVS